MFSEDLLSQLNGSIFTNCTSQVSEPSDLLHKPTSEANDLRICLALRLSVLPSGQKQKQDCIWVPKCNGSRLAPKGSFCIPFPASSGGALGRTQTLLQRVFEIESLHALAKRKSLAVHAHSCCLRPLLFRVVFQSRPNCGLQDMFLSGMISGIREVEGQILSESAICARYADIVTIS